jgi:hypothetical protein
MAERNMAAEQSALKTFGATTGKMPSTPQDWNVAHRMAYSSPEQYPDEFKNKNPEWQKLYQTTAPDLAKGSVTGITPAPPVAPTTLEAMGQQGQADLNKATTDRATALGQAQDFNSGTSSFFNTLQQAIKAKTGHEQTGTGESEIFKKAGLTGFDSLNQSLAMRNKELESSSNYLTDTLTKMGGIFQTQAANVKLGYDDAVKRYENASKEVQDAAKAIAENKAAIDRLNLQHKLDMETKAYEASKWQIQDVRGVDDEGNATVRSVQFNPATNEIREIGGGTVSSKGKTITVGEHDYDLSTYATDPAHVKKLEGIIGGIGKFNDATELDNYLKSKGSAITSEEVQAASTKFGVPWEMIVGLQQLESGLGTSNVAKSNNNPGGITWSPTYEASHPGVTKGTARPAAEGGNYVKFPTMQDGLNATVEQLAKREVDRPEGYYASESIKDLVASSKYATKEQRKSFDRLIDSAMKVGGWPLAFEKAKTWMYDNEFQGSEKKEAKSADDQIMMFSKAEEIVNKVPVDLGPWNRIKEKNIKPWIGVDKDIATAEFNQWAAFGQAALRNGLFGSQLTSGEQQLSNDFLIDLDKDDAQTIKMKIANLKQIAEFHRDLLYGKTMGIEQKDVPKNELDLYGSPKSGGATQGGSGGELSSQVTAKGYDYDRLKADGYSDDDIKKAVGL